MKVIGLLLLSCLAACSGNSRQLENYGDITQGPGGIALVTEAEHPGGWRQRDCLTCHNVNLNVHRNPGTIVNGDTLNDLIRTNGESAYCLRCHGPNE